MSKLAEENAGVTEARFLFSTSKYTLAITNCLDILSQLGQTFPSQPNLNDIQAELLHIQPLLLGLTFFDQMKRGRQEEVASNEDLEPNVYSYSDMCDPMRCLF